ncbi:ligand-binding sensor domain-containing diguanylate cyclase [Alteromonas ponticola]|uniref:diguanylate cyclase n=1 Tax=Alteromonas ponticola TaxID=2720613 RepID=A0ABX1R2J1_9ALTE|nr:ligand-binding sensor domain-containing diguanylate cyclase [Alteromonas ponticola]NMH60689.1 diguanylate cyclase [Alteromonas ponticola]
MTTQIRFSHCLRCLVFCICLISGVQADTLFEHPIFHSPLANVSGIDGDIVSITEDKRGFIWFVSSNGLWRWDSHIAERATFADASSEKFSPIVQTVTTDSHGQVWVGTNRGLYRLDSDKRILREVSSAVAVLSIQDIAVVNDSSTAIYFATDRAVYRYSPAADKLAAVTMPYEARIHALHTQGTRLFVGTGNGLLVLDVSQATPILEEVAGFPSAVRISAITSTASQQLLVGTASQGLFVQTGAQQFAQHRLNEQAEPWIYALTVVNPSTVLLGTFGKGLFLFDLSSAAVKHSTFDPLHPAGLASDNIWTLLTDSRGLVWLGANTTLQLYDATNPGLKHILGGTTSEVGLHQRQVHAVQAFDAFLIAATGSGGLEKLDPVSGESMRLLEQSKDPIETLALIEDGRLFASSNFASTLIDLSSTAHQDLMIPGRPVKKYTAAIAQTDETLWVGGTDGLWAYQPASKKAENWLLNTNLERRIASLLATKERLWIGTWQGLLILNYPNAEIAEVEIAPQSPVLLKEQFIADLYQDSLNQLWAGTSNAGLFVYREQHGWQQLDVDANQAGGTIEAIAGEVNGKIYASTSKHIVAVDIESLEVSSVVTGPAAINAPFRRGAATIMHNDVVVFGGANGLTLLEPAKLTGSATPLSIVLTEGTILTADNKTLSPSLLSSQMEAPALARRISFEFTALDYLTPAQLVYRYRLNGFDEDWTVVDSEHRVATFTQLDPGRYQLQVHYSDDGVNWQPNGIERTIIVPAAWYQTWVTKTVLFLFVALILLGLHRLRVNKLHARQLILEQRVAARTAELVDANKVLQQQAQALRDASLTDALTGLHNRRFLTQNIERDVAKLDRYYADCHRNAVTPDDTSDLLFFLIDIDHFKSINDNYGHPIGDKVLVETAARLTQVFREIDYLIRWGGEEFLVVVHDTPRADAAALAERVRNCIRTEQYDIKENEAISVTCSIGYAAYPLDSTYFASISWETTIGIADLALYAAKNNHRDTWLGFTMTNDKTNKQAVQKIQQEPAFVFEYGKIEKRLQRADCDSSFAMANEES